MLIAPAVEPLGQAHHFPQSIDDAIAERPNDPRLHAAEGLLELAAHRYDTSASSGAVARPERYEPVLAELLAYPDVPQKWRRLDLDAEVLEPPTGGL